MPTQKFGKDLDPSEMGRRSGEARQAHADKEGMERLRAEAPTLFNDLVAAAKGKSPFKELPIEKRFAALKLALEYAYGRPRPIKADEDQEPDGTTEESDDSFQFEASHKAEPRPTDGVRNH